MRKAPSFQQDTDTVRLDAAKHYATVLAELDACWDMLRPGGVLIGNDIAWKQVQAAVENFAERNGHDFTTDGPKWIFRKPREVAVAEGGKPVVAIA